MSIVPGTSITEGYVFNPSTIVSFGLMGITVYPCRRKARIARLPNLRGFDEAPITATILRFWPVSAIWKDFTRIQDAARIERGLHALHQRDLVARKFQTQIRRLGETDAMLTAD